MSPRTFLSVSYWIFWAVLCQKFDFNNRWTAQKTEMDVWWGKEWELIRASWGTGRNGVCLGCQTGTALSYTMWQVGQDSTRNHSGTLDPGQDCNCSAPCYVLNPLELLVLLRTQSISYLGTLGSLLLPIWLKLRTTAKELTSRGSVCCCESSTQDAVVELWNRDHRLQKVHLKCPYRKKGLLGEALEVGYVSDLLIETGSQVSHALLTLALQVHLELWLSCFYLTDAKITSGATKTSEDSSGHWTQQSLHPSQPLCNWGVSVDYFPTIQNLTVTHWDLQLSCIVVFGARREHCIQPVGFFSWWTHYCRFLCQWIITLLSTPWWVHSLCV